MLKRGIEARVVGEAVARAATMREALHAIEDSPSHRLTVTDPRFTDAGLRQGSKMRRGRTCAVILLASWPRKVPLSSGCTRVETATRLVRLDVAWYTATRDLRERHPCDQIVPTTPVRMAAMVGPWIVASMAVHCAGAHVASDQQT